MVDASIELTDKNQLLACIVVKHSQYTFPRSFAPRGHFGWLLFILGLFVYVYVQTGEYHLDHSQHRLCHSHTYAQKWPVSV